MKSKFYSRSNETSARSNLQQKNPKTIFPVFFKSNSCQRTSLKHLQKTAYFIDVKHCFYLLKNMCIKRVIVENMYMLFVLLLLQKFGRLKVYLSSFCWYVLLFQVILWAIKTILQFNAKLLYVYQLKFSIKTLRALHAFLSVNLHFYEDFNEEEYGQSENEEFEASGKVILLL